MNVLAGPLRAITRWWQLTKARQVKEECSFLKKRTKKLLTIGARLGPAASLTLTLKQQKFFVSFFQKRNTCFRLPSARLRLGY
jgi:hypothetical protein